MDTYIILSLDSKLIQTKKIEGNEISIGRDSINDICINNLAVSRFHAKIYKNSEKIILEDMDSSNGTYVNGQKIDTMQIYEDDNVLIGKYNLRIEFKPSENQSNQNFAYVEDSTVMVDDNTRDKFLNKLGYQSGNNEIPHDDQHYPKLIISDVLEIKIEKNLFILGKSIDSDVYLDGFFIKKRHATIIRRADGKLVLINNSSLFNKTRINGNVVDQRVLANGDVIKIGKHKMIYLS